MINKLSDIVYEEYKWTIPEDVPIKIPNEDFDNMNDYLKNCYLKELLHTIMNDTNFQEISYWIVHSRGRIKSLKENEKNNELIRKFKEKINNNADIKFHCKVF